MDSLSLIHISGCMDFAFTGEHFGIRYELGAGPCSARENLGIVTVRHPEGDWSGAREALESFLKRRAKKVFEPVLRGLACLLYTSCVKRARMSGSPWMGTRTG